jgi:transcriptional regulator with XRE-family HTH domain
MMAEAMGMEAEHLSGIEHGEISLTEIHVERSAEYFGIPYEYLLPYAFPERYSKPEPKESDRPIASPASSNVISLDDHRPA